MSKMSPFPILNSAHGRLLFLVIVDKKQDSDEINSARNLERHVLLLGFGARNYNTECLGVNDNSERVLYIQSRSWCL